MINHAEVATSFELVLENSRRALTVSANISSLEVVRAAGAGVLSSREEGVGGTC